MQFNVSQLLMEPTGATRQHDIDDDIAGLDPDLHPLSRIRGKAKFTKTDQKILVTSQLRVTLELECSRCLETFSEEVDISLEEEFQPRFDIRTGVPLPEEEIDPALAIDQHNMLDMSETVRQALILASEDHVLCRETCKGLCPECGQNLNMARCSCTPAEVDPRWAALQQLAERARIEDKSKS